MILWFWYFKSLLYEQFLYQNVKAIGGSGVIKIYQAYFVELVAVVSTLFTERQNLILFRRYDQCNFGGS